MNGNEALGFRIDRRRCSASARAYPITPWSDIMELLRRELPKYGGNLWQTEDEIAASAMAIGASYAGRVAVTGSSGPGDFLETEHWAGRSWRKLPLVIVDVNAAALQPDADEHRAVRFEHRSQRRPMAIRPRVRIAPANSKIVFTWRLKPSTSRENFPVPVIF